MRFIRRSILNQLRISFLLLILFSVVAGIASYYLLNRVTLQQEAKFLSGEAIAYLASARQAEKTFLLTDRKSEAFLTSGESPALAQHHLAIQTALTNLEKVSESSVSEELGLTDQIQHVVFSFQQYERTFLQLVAAYQKRGFKDHGLEGEMRSYVHALQQCVSPEEKVFAYSLRRHEKDFMLRKDLRYVEKLEATAAEFKDFVRNSEQEHMTPEYKLATLQGIDQYQQQFARIVNLEESIGLVESEGITGKLSKEASEIGPVLQDIQTSLEESSRDLQQRAVWVMLAGLGILLSIGITVALYLSAKISRPIQVLDQVARKVVQGDNQAAEKLKTLNREDEVGRLVTSFRTMLNSLNSHLGEVRQQKEALEVARAADDERSRTSEGLAQFSDLLKNSFDSLHALGQAFISDLVKFIGANQATLFITEGNDTDLHLRQYATYAYNRYKKTGMTLAPGEGLIGAAYLERDTIFLTEVPEHYVSIGSGLGDGRPRCVLIVPVMTDEMVAGVIEIASFKVFTAHEINFVEQVAGRLATTLNALKLQANTRELLQESQHRESQLLQTITQLEGEAERYHTSEREIRQASAEAVQKATAAIFKVDMLDAIISKIYPGVIITDKDFSVIYANKYTHLKVGPSSGTSVDTGAIHQFIKAPFRQLVDNLTNDPDYLLNDISGEVEATFLEEGIATPIDLVATIVRQGDTIRYAFLFRNHDANNGKAMLKEILRRQLS